MKISLVIPVYNGLTHLQKNLPIISTLGADEVVLVDDCSTDTSYDFITRHYPQFTCIRHVRNQRFPLTANDGFKAASGDVVILLNQDVTPAANLVSRVRAHFTDDTLFAITLNEGERSWAKGEFHHGFIHFTQGPLDDQVHESLWASGGSAAFSRTKWLQLGGFDPVFTPGYYEDFDIGWRARKKGWTILWYPDTRVTHAHPESSFSTTFDSRALVRLKERNYLLSHWKNLSLVQLIEHKIFLIFRICTRPGYIVPTAMALSRLPSVIKFRLHA